MEIENKKEKSNKLFLNKKNKIICNLIIIGIIAIYFCLKIEKNIFFVSFYAISQNTAIRVSIMAITLIFMVEVLASALEYTLDSFKSMVITSVIMFLAIEVLVYPNNFENYSLIIDFLSFVILCTVSFFARIKITKEQLDTKKNFINTNKIICIITNFFFVLLLAYALHFGIVGPIVISRAVVKRAYIFSLFLFMLFYMFLLSIFKKSSRTILILGIIIIALSLISDIKYYYSDNPVYLSDIFFLGNAGEITSLVTKEIFIHIDYYMILAEVEVVVLAYILSKSYVIELENIKERGMVLGINLLIWIILLIPIPQKDSFILNNVFMINDRLDYLAVTDGKSLYLRNGILGEMYDSLIEARGVKPDNYDEKDLKEELDKAEKIPKETSTYGKPNIIIMFQESMWDIENLEEIDYNIDVTAELDKLKKLGAHAKFLSPSYGGLSSNIEFELLTGGNLRFYSFGYNPISQLYRSAKSTRYPSIVKDFNNNGYKTSVLFGRDYYNSKGVYSRIGMQSYTDTFKDWPEYQSLVKGNFISDEALVNDALDRLRNKEDDEKILHMACTIQTHMPFYKEKYPEYDLEYIKSELTTEQEEIVLSYAQGVYETNLQIKRLYDEIQNIDDPTIVIVLGDHLPHLYDSNGVDILLSSRYFNTGDEREDLVRKYTTDLFVFSNFGYKPEFAGEYVSPDLVLTTIINDLDMEISPYYKWLYNNTSKEIAALNQFLVVDKDGNYYLTSDKMPKEIEEALEKRKKMQYYLFR